MCEHLFMFSIEKNTEWKPNITFGIANQDPFLLQSSEKF